MLLPLLLVLAMMGSAAAASQETLIRPGSSMYSESLDIHQFSDGKVACHLNLSHTLLTNTGILDHTSFFPKAMAELTQTFDVRELHLSFTQGRWDYEDWGLPVTSQSAAPSGVQLWAWLGE
jgi:phosphatidylinositol glycan class T